MRKLTRLGVIILTISLSLILVNLVRNGSTFSLTTQLPVKPKEQNSHIYFLRPRDLDLQVNAPPVSTITICDPSNTTILQINNVTHASYTLHLQKRGGYNFSVYNPTNSSINVELHLTLYNLENDITQASIALIVTGAALISVQQIRARIKHATETLVSKEATTSQ